MASNFKVNDVAIDQRYIQFTELGFPKPSTNPVSLWGWGGNTYGQLGLGYYDVTRRSVPVILNAIPTWRDIYLGNSSSFAIKTNNSLWAWGHNNYGLLGLGDVVHRSVPNQVGSLNDWQLVESGKYHTLSIKTNGSLWSWGYNAYYQLGLGATTVNQPFPVQIGSLTNWTKVAVGNSSSFAVNTNGEIWAWGYNADGRLGVGNTTTYFSTPVKVGSATNWNSIVSGRQHSLALNNLGELWSWGLNTSGQLGLGHLTTTSSPIRVGTATNWNLIKSGLYFSAAINTNGQLWAWGHNLYGQLGLGHSTNCSTPVQVGAATNWSKISLGEGAIIAIKTDGTLWGWGHNFYGTLGLGDINHRSSPVQIGSLTNWSSVSSGSFHVMSLKPFY